MRGTFLVSEKAFVKATKRTFLSASVSKHVVIIRLLWTPPFSDRTTSFHASSGLFLTTILNSYLSSFLSVELRLAMSLQDFCLTASKVSMSPFRSIALSRPMEQVTCWGLSVGWYHYCNASFKQSWESSQLLSTTSGASLTG